MKLLKESVNKSKLSTLCFLIFTLGAFPNLAFGQKTKINTQAPTVSKPVQQKTSPQNQGGIAGEGKHDFPIGQLCDNWEYVKIIKPGKTIEPFTIKDTMALYGTSRFLFHRDIPYLLKDTGFVFFEFNKFNYSIPTINKIASGRFILLSVPRDSSQKFGTGLLFHYDTNINGAINVNRLFNIEELNKNSLVIREGNTYFHYRRIRSLQTH